MLFVSNFNGTWDQYIDAFSDGIPNGLDLFWYSSTKYPGSIPITPFKNYIRANQIDTDYYYNATPGAAQRDIKAALQGLGGSSTRWRSTHQAMRPDGLRRGLSQGARLASRTTCASQATRRSPATTRTTPTMNREALIRRPRT